MKCAGIVLCGGESRRMGLPKATLPLGDELMLPRVLRLLGQVVDPLYAVAAPGQSLPDLPAGVRIARDEREGRGPLEAIHAGLEAIRAGLEGAADRQADAAYITSCDVPLLVPAFVERLLELLDTHRIVVPVERKFHHPLAAVYRTDILPELEQLRAADRMRPVFLFDRVDTLRVPVDELRDVDPDLLTLVNVNTPQDYLTVSRRAGFEPPADVLERLQP